MEKGQNPVKLKFRICCLNSSHMICWCENCCVLFVYCAVRTLACWAPTVGERTALRPISLIWNGCLLVAWVGLLRWYLLRVQGRYK
jgi:hypothetical protein